MVTTQRLDELTSKMEGNNVFKSSFYEEFENMLSAKDPKNMSYMNSAQYNKFIEEVKEAKQSAKRSTLHYRRLKRFDICNISGTDKLIAPVSTTDPVIKYYVKNEELFDILHEIHVSIGHGGRNRMVKEAQQKYKNITQEAIMIFLRLCKSCQMKLKSGKKGIVVKPILSNEMNSRCQVDLIDMQTNPDGNFKFILVYQDHLTKFVQLRPLHSKTAEEVAKVLLDIFCIFGAPSILQSDNGREFANRIVENLTSMWTGLKIIHGKPRHSQSQGSVERANQDVQNILMTWMKDENCDKWSEGLRFVQLMKNRAHHDGIKRSPYKAMFGCDVKVGLKSSGFPSEVIDNVSTEEELEELLRNQQEREQSIDDIQSGEEMVLSDECEICINKNDLCDLCSKKDAIINNRIEAKANLAEQAKKMKSLSNIKYPPCNVGDNVRVKIPDVDRGRGDFRNIILTVLQCSENGLYKLGNEKGTIPEMFSRNQFTVCESKFVNIENVSADKKSLRQLANLQSTSGGQGFKKCHCKTKCGTKKCLCKAANILCNSKCHSSLSCNNK